MKRVVLSLSGGLDSTALLVHFLKKNYKIDAISFNYGQRNDIELKKSIKNIDYLRNKGFYIIHKIVDLSTIMNCFYSCLTDKNIKTPEGNYADENMKITVVPNRNTIFSSIIYGYALSIAKQQGIDVLIALAVHSGDHTIYPDCRPEFYLELEKIFKKGNWGGEAVKFILPYLYKNKGEILKELLDNCDFLNLSSKNIISNTNTCYNPTKKGLACGKCGSCIERLEAFQENKLTDFIEYIGGN